MRLPTVCLLIALAGCAAPVTNTHIGPEPSDISDARISARIQRQSRAYRFIEDAGARCALGLSGWHPQCYFDMRARLDASLVSLPPDDQACLRKAARWSAALRARELCDRSGGAPPPDGFDCAGRLVRLRQAEALLGDPPGTCHPVMPDPPRPDEIRDLIVTCRALDP